MAEKPIHTFECAWQMRGSVCNCPAFVQWLEWMHSYVVDEATRGIDYSRLTALAEGYWEDGDEGDSE